MYLSGVSTPLNQDAIPVYWACPGVLEPARGACRSAPYARESEQAAASGQHCGACGEVLSRKDVHFGAKRTLKWAFDIARTSRTSSVTRVCCYSSLPDPERQHVIDAARFELGKVESPVVRQCIVALFDLVDRELATRVAPSIVVQPRPETS